MSLFEFTESGPLNDGFDYLGYDSKNFLVNSGSYFIILLLILLNFSCVIALELMASKFPKQACCRRFGMRMQAQGKPGELRHRIKKVMLETYFEITLCAFLGLI